LENLDLYIESLIFASVKPIHISELQLTLNTHFNVEISKDDILVSIAALKKRYRSEAYSFEILEIAEGFQFMTKGAYHPLVGQHLRLESKKKLSRAALETLAIISYKQPVTKTQMESIRGVNCDYSVQKLLEKELVEIVGRDSGPGQPLLYATTIKFMDHFGLKDLNELPQLKEFETETNSIGLSEEE
jgi:segregation and condensation protein B